ncbi:sigma-70 family RNA polymerase sigma factor [Patulibacter sp. SYSU D01012]|uniref:sigma-70 family RNA polymerase sigma factor n=1 Tax=Patulibacter sp. SYSU D01012 TaxID=2817381 RepID=UPI0032BF9E60
MSTTPDVPTRRAAGTPLEAELEAHRRALTGYCYRMLGSSFEAEDAVQETMVRAWRRVDGLQERAALRSWLYRIATNVCLDLLQGAKRRARPVDMGPSSEPDGSLLGQPLADSAFVSPVPDARLDPAEAADRRDTVRLAFVAALQHLPPRQRAVLVLREVLHWRAAEVAALLETSVPSVNSALQRARATLDALDLTTDTTAERPDGEAEQRLLARYVDAFERYDVDELVTLLREDVEFCMPPFRLWLRGPRHVAAWLVGPGIGCSGSRVRTTMANGRPAFGAYRPAGPRVWRPFSLTVLETDGERITAIHNNLDVRLFPHFGLPEQLEED